MTKRLISLCLLAFLAVANTNAQDPDLYLRRPASPTLPPFLLSGLDAYKSKNAEEAIRLWLKDGPLEDNKDAISQSAILHQAEAAYGAYQYYEVILTRNISTRTQIIYLVLNYEQGPLFAKFNIYRANHRWVLSDFLLNSREDAVLPPVQYAPKPIEP